MAHTTTTTTKPRYVTEEGFGYNLSPNSSRLANLSNGAVARFEGHRNPVRIALRETNHLVSGLISKGGQCDIWINDYQVYTFRYQDTLLAVVKLVQVLDRIRNFPVPLNGREDCEKLICRPVWYREFPAMLTDFDGERGQVLLQADTLETRFIPEPWNEGEEQTSEAQVRVDLLSPHIWWFREAEG